MKPNTRTMSYFDSYSTKDGAITATFIEWCEIFDEYNLDELQLFFFNTFDYKTRQYFRTYMMNRFKDHKKA